MITEITASPRVGLNSAAEISQTEPAPSWRKREIVLFVFTSSIFVAARLWRFTSYGLFGDEVFTLWTAQQDWSSLFSSVVGDVVHPPLFYALLKVWIGVGGQSLVWLKLLPAALSVLSIAPFFFLCRELNVPARVTNIALWLMAVNGFLINHAQELRGYSLLLLLTLCSLALFAKLIRADKESRSRGNQIALLVVNLLLVFTHYYGWLLVATELAALALLNRRRVRGFSIAVSVLVLCFSPWLYLVAQAARSNPSRVNFVWNRPPPISEIIGYYANLNGSLSYRWKVFGTAVVMIVFLLPLIAMGRRMIKATRAGCHEACSRFWLLVLFACAPPVVAFAASHLLPQPVWAFRYLIIAAPAYLLLIALASQELQRKELRMIFVLLVVGWAAVSGGAEMIHRDRVSWEPLVNRMALSEREQARPINVYVADPNVGNTIQFYLDQAGETRFQVTAVESLSSPPDDHSWIALIHYKHEREPPVQDRLAADGHKIGAVIEAEASGHTAVLFPVWKRRSESIIE